MLTNHNTEYSNEYRINKKYKLEQLISKEPFGEYHTCVDAQNNKYLVLILDFKLTKIVRENQELLLSKLNILDNNYNNSIIPIKEIEITYKETYIIMSYQTGVSLGEYLNTHKNPIKLTKIIKLLNNFIKVLSKKHGIGLYHGFINFSTVWITDDHKLMLVGFDFFKVIFHDFLLSDSEFNQTRISSCISQDQSVSKINCSISSDYYSVLVIIYSLLQGCIAESNNFNILNNLNNKTQKLLSLEYNRKLYQTNHSLENWLGQIKRANRLPIIESSAAVLVLTIVTLQVFYQYQDDIKNTYIYSLFRHNYKSTYKNIVKISDSTSKYASHCVNFYYNGFYNLNNYIGNLLVNKQNIKKSSVKNSQKISSNNLLSINKADLNIILKLNKNNYISKHNYFAYCYLSDNCDYKNDLKNDLVYSENDILNCIFNQKCNNKIEKILEQPVLNLSLKDIKEYLAWTNKFTDYKYEVISDLDFLVKVSNKIKPEASCADNQSNNYSGNYSSWVKIDNKYLIRSKAILKNNQCVFVLNNIDNQSTADSNAIVRINQIS